jgi:hypothetical protein
MGGGSDYAALLLGTGTTCATLLTRVAPLGFFLRPTTRNQRQFWLLITLLVFLLPLGLGLGGKSSTLPGSWRLIVSSQPVRIGFPLTFTRRFWVQRGNPIPWDYCVFRNHRMSP